MPNDKLYFSKPSEDEILRQNLLAEASYKEQLMIDTGKRIKEARQLNHMTQQQLATKIGKTESSIRKYEKGIVNIPLGVLEDISRVLNVSSEKLVYGTEENKKREEEIRRFDMLLHPKQVNMCITQLLSSIGYTISSPDAPYKRITPSHQDLSEKLFIDNKEIHLEMNGADYKKLQEDILSYIDYLLYKYGKENPN